MHSSPDDPLRYRALLGSLSCWLCGSGAFADCDLAAHQQYANARYACSACQAGAGEICRPDCPAATTTADFIDVVQGI